MSKRGRLAIVIAVFLTATLTVGAAGALTDFGSFVQAQLRHRAPSLFGVAGPLAASSTASLSAAEASAHPERLATVAKSLQVRVVSHGVAAPNLDQSALWPNDAHPRWLIVCNEEGVADPGLVRINLASGAQEVIVTGTSDCDPVRRTPWGTILFGEEAGGGPEGGRMYELVDPLHTTGVTLDRATGTFSGGSGAANLTARPALGRLSFEGLAIYPNGVTYYGDENRPAQGVPGGAYFKFIPATLRDPAAAAITTLADSPYATPGSIYGLRLGRREGGTDYGQGTQYGLGAWVPIPAAADPDLRAQAAALHLTGYYRPEDADIDQAAQAEGRVRFCANNTGNEPDDQLWGEAVCLSDGTLTKPGPTPAPQRSNCSSPAARLWPCPTTSPISPTGATGSSTRTPRPSPTGRARTTMICGTACRTAPTPICRVTAASASPP
jgi:hypothetical protein